MKKEFVVMAKDLRIGDEVQLGSTNGGWHAVTDIRRGGFGRIAGGPLQTRLFVRTEVESGYVGAFDTFPVRRDDRLDPSGGEGPPPEGPCPVGS